MSQQYPQYGQPVPSYVGPPKKGLSGGMIFVLVVLGSFFALCAGCGVLGLIGAASSPETSDVAAESDDALSSDSATPSTSTSSSTSARASSTTASARATTSDAPALGDSVKSGDLTFVVSEVREGGTSVGSDYLTEEAQGRFVIVTLSIKNDGDAAETFFDSNVTINDADGRSFEPNSMAAIYAGDSGKDIWLEQINPGNTVKGDLYFDMPEGADPVSVTLTGSFFSEGVTVQVR